MTVELTNSTAAFFIFFANSPPRAKNICQLHYEHLGAGTAPPHAFHTGKTQTRLPLVMRDIVDPPPPTELSRHVKSAAGINKLQNLKQ